MSSDKLKAEKYTPPTYNELVNELDELHVMYNAKKAEVAHYKALYLDYVEESFYKNCNGE